MKKKCPGQDISRKSLEEAVSSHACPGCGYEIEFFFDDLRRICPRCGIEVAKTADRIIRDFGCAAWCSGAEACLGSAAYDRLKKAKKK